MSYPSLNNDHNPQPSAPILDEMEQFWDARLEGLKKDYKSSVFQNPKIMRVAGAALAGVAAVFGALSFDFCMTFTATPWVVLGVTGAAAGITIAVTLLGIYLLVKKYNQITPEIRIHREQEVAKMVNSNMKFTELQAACKAKEISFDDITLDLIFFKKQVNDLSFDAFMKAHGANAVQRLVPERKDALRKKFIATIAADHRPQNEITSTYRDELSLFSINTEEVWQTIKGYEATLGYKQFITRNGEGRLKRVSEEERSMLGDSFMTETFNELKDLNQYRSKLKIAKELGKEEAFKKYTSEWFIIQTSGAKPMSLKAMVAKFGIDVIDTTFMQEGSNRDKVVTEFVDASNFTSDWQMTERLMGQKMLSEAHFNTLRNNFGLFIKTLQGLNDVQNRFKNVIVALNVSDAAIVAHIGEYEASLGYGQFIKRNGVEAFQHLNDSLKESIRSSFMGQMVIKNLDLLPNIIKEAAAIGIKDEVIKNRAVEWFKADGAKNLLTNLYEYIRTYGKAVIDAAYLSKDDPKVQKMVKEYLANYEHTSAWWLLFERLVHQKLVTEEQRKLVINVQQEVQKVLNEVDAIKSKSTHELNETLKQLEMNHEKQVADRQASHAEFVSQSTEAIKALQNETLSLAQFKLSLESQLQNMATQYEQKVHQINDGDNELKHIATRLVELEAALKTTDAEAIDEEMKAIGKAIVELDVDAVRNEIQKIEQQISSIRNHEALKQSLQAQRAELADVEAKIGDASLTVEKLIAKKQVTGPAEALKAILPGSEYRKQPAEIDRKIELLQRRDKLRASVSSLEARVKSSMVDTSELTKLEAEKKQLNEKFNQLNQRRAAPLERIKVLATAKAEYEKIPHEIKALCVKQGALSANRIHLLMELEQLQAEKPKKMLEIHVAQKKQDDKQIQLQFRNHNLEAKNNEENQYINALIEHKQTQITQLKMAFDTQISQLDQKMNTVIARIKADHKKHI